MSTTQAGPVCEPKKRDSRPFRLGEFDVADDGEHTQRHEHGHGKEVLDESQRPPPPDQRHEEVPVEERPVGLEDGEHQDREAPEGEGVRQPWDRPPQELALAADLGELRPRTGPEPGESLRVGATLPDQPEQVGETATGDGESDDGHAQAEGDPDGQRLLLEGQARKFSKYRLGVGPRCPWYFEPKPAVP